MRYTPNSTTRVAGPEGSGASPNSFWFVLIALGAGLWVSKLMSWCRMGLFARARAPEAGALAMFAAAGEKSAVDAPDRSVRGRARTRTRVRSMESHA